MKFLVYSLKLLTWSSTLTLITCLPLQTQEQTNELKNNPPQNLLEQTSHSPQNVSTSHQEGKPLVRENLFVLKHFPLNTRSISVRVLNQDDAEDFDGDRVVLEGIDEHLVPRIKREIKKLHGVGKKGNIVENIDGDPYIREETSVLLIIVAVLICLLCIYYYCTCCIFIYYLKSQFCFDIDLYKKPEPLCPAKACERRYSC